MSKFQRDLFERVVRTFVQAALATVATDLAGATDLSSLKALGIAAIAAGISAILGLFSRGFGDPESASIFNK